MASTKKDSNPRPICHLHLPLDQEFVFPNCVTYNTRLWKLEHPKPRLQVTGPMLFGHFSCLIEEQFLFMFKSNLKLNKSFQDIKNFD